MSSYLSRPRSLEQAKLEADMSLNAPSNAIQGMLAEGTEGLAKGALLEKEYGLKDLTGKDHNMFVETGYDMLTDPTALVGPLRHAFTSAGRVLKNPVKSYANRVGYLFVALAMALFFMAFLFGFTSVMATLVIMSLVIGCVLLAPSIILGYAVKAADRDDRERGL